MRYSLFVFLQAAGCVRETGPVVVIESQLTQTQQKQLTKAAQLLGGKQVQSFSRAGTFPLSSCVKEWAVYHSMRYKLMLKTLGSVRFLNFLFLKIYILVMAAVIVQYYYNLNTFFPF